MSYEAERATAKAALKHQEEQCAHTPHPCPLTDHQRTFDPGFCEKLLDENERYEKALLVWVCRGHREGGVGTHQAGNIDCDLARDALNPTEANDD